LIECLSQRLFARLRLNVQVQWLTLRTLKSDKKLLIRSDKQAE
jgi:hypothetical protein